MARTIIVFEIENPGDLDHQGFKMWIVGQLKRLTAHVQSLNSGAGLVKARYAAIAIDPTKDISDFELTDVVNSQLVPALLREELKPLKGVKRL